jgi:hypothetical protein
MNRKEKNETCSSTVTVGNDAWKYINTNLNTNYVTYLSASFQLFSSAGEGAAKVGNEASAGSVDVHFNLKTALQTHLSKKCETD